MSKSLVLLSGEQTTVPEAEARALFLAYDARSRFESPEQRVLEVESGADPFLVGSRIAFSRRVGRLIESPDEARESVTGKKVRVRAFDLANHGPPLSPGRLLSGLDVEVDLGNPDYEFSVVRGRKEYIALTRPSEMSQTWSDRRPRTRPFFHPAAIFPKLSRALVNLTRFKAGDIFLDPFSGTGSLGLEACEAGAQVIVSDRAEKMTRGSLANMKHFQHQWLGVIRADAICLPVRNVDAIATDVPYGRASSTGGSEAKDVLAKTLDTLPDLLSRGSRLVVMHPLSLAIRDVSGLELEEEHNLYVHKFLTRTISILRRR